MNLIPRVLAPSVAVLLVLLLSAGSAFAQVDDSHSDVDEESPPSLPDTFPGDTSDSDEVSAPELPVDAQSGEEEPLAPADDAEPLAPAGEEAPLDLADDEDAVTPTNNRRSNRASEDEAEAWAADSPSADMALINAIVGSDKAARKDITGAGIGVALIDTGVAPVNGLTDVIHGPDLSLDSQVDGLYQLDVYGHGTHLAGIITSDAPEAQGIAPDATLVSLKVGSANGAVDVTQVIAAIDWVVQHRAEHNIRVLVLAYGTDSDQDPLHDPLSHAVETAWRNGITVVVAAGNSGETRDAVSNPATNPYVIAVGAVDTNGTERSKDDVLADFSAPGTDTRRPDVVAPGVGVVSTRVPGSFLDNSYEAARRSETTFRGNGTSQAAAVVGGAVALLLQDRPELSPDDVKNVLRESANRTHNREPGSGSGMIDLRKALKKKPKHSAQTFAASIGDGSIEAARGTHHLTDGTTLLQGEFDLHGQPFDSAAWARAATLGTSWDGGTWNGVAWTGTGWTGLSWGGLSWGGNSWDGLSWGGLSWGGLSWGGLSWGGLSWGSESWDGLSWGGLSWGGDSWDGLSWGGLSWGGDSWDGLSWGGLSWGGLSWGSESWTSVRWS